MASLRPCLFFILLCISIINHAHSKNVRKTYIVYMGDHPKGMDSTSIPSLHTAMAQKVLGSDFKPEALLHSYKNFNAFVMKLTEEEAERTAEMENVISVFPNSKKSLHTTRSWNFIDFPQNVKRETRESDIIVGVLDSGIWPESESFSGKGFGPPPSRWKGSCHNFTCNNKIIGAKYFNLEHEFAKEDIISPRDAEGHGSHCASTVAGNSVNSVSLFGLASGAARGGVPSARIAVYKVCWKEHCHDDDILAAFDEAISDGVDIISISIGPRIVHYFPYFQDPTHIGSFHAMKRGILTSNSGGNEGPSFSSMSNLAPWLLSVAASSFDRKIVTKVQLGNGAVYEGVSINTFNLKKKLYPLIYGGDIPNIAGGHNSSTSRYCIRNSLDKDSVKGKIVLCEITHGTDIDSLSGIGAVGVILGSNSPQDSASAFVLPAAILSPWNQRLIHSYITSTRNATATIFKSEEINDGLIPFVASFSSRGPNPITPNTLKPDIAAPGVEVIAAWSPVSPISDVKGDKRKVQYNVISGTSMACPHASAAAAYIKSFHPNWSPAMIKSALMTTATPMSHVLNPEAEFAYGAGLINPVKAANPGLVYDISEADYIKFLCGEGYTDEMLRNLTKDHSSCKVQASKRAVYELNLPSFALFTNHSTFSRAYFRTVTNVGSATATYKARVIASPLLQIQVKPSTLSFTSIGQKKSFSLIIEGITNLDIISASLIWDDGSHQVRSPIVVYGRMGM
ncbi:cucumisin [Cajanus cajan]|uniref:cucumisin n=1 Tax=Cajanus cajan TaxID=3821 RepID=UPI00098D7D08|nr:cucumisin [Cajanus cajan]